MHQETQWLRAVARALIMNEAGELLLCRSRNGKAWVPPGGTVERGETLQSAALREAAEEAGLPVSPGPLAYVQEFRPADRDEHVVEVAFYAVTLADRPPDDAPAQAAGPADRPWAAWYMQDMDGPRREVRWFTRAQVASLIDPVYPAYLRERFWTDARAHDPYLGLVEEK